MATRERVLAAIDFVVGVTSAVAFLAITDAVLEGEITRFDRAVVLGLHGFDSPLLDVVMRGLSFVGSVYFVAPLVVVVAATAWVRERRELAAGLVAVAVTTVILNVTLKNIFRRPRPTLFFEIARPNSFSFPSGHAMASTAIYGMVAFVLGRVHPRIRRPVYALSATLVVLIGISRVYLGVHWPTDVLAGWAAAAMVLAGTRLAGREWSSRGE